MGFVVTAPIPKPPRKWKQKSKAQLAAARLLDLVTTPSPPPSAAPKASLAPLLEPINTPSNKPP
jgi:hypothetical protein